MQMKRSGSDSVMPLQCATVSLACSAVGDTGHKTPSPKLTLPAATTSATERDPAAPCTLQVQMHNSGRGVRPRQRLKWKRGGSFRFCIICGEEAPALEIAHGFVTFVVGAGDRSRCQCAGPEPRAGQGVLSPLPSHY